MSEQEALSHTDLKHSGVGIASFAISITLGVLTLVAFVIAPVIVFVLAFPPGALDEISVEEIEEIIEMYVYATVVVHGIAGLVALGLGIGGLIQKERKKIFAILGTVFSAPVIVAAVLVLIFTG